MAYLHSLDVLHGDLTGGNVLLSSVAGGGNGGNAAAGASAPTPAPTSSSSSPLPPSAAATVVPRAAPAADFRGWTAKVADLGLARVLSCDAISTGTYGTVTHMPPELLTGEKA